MSLDLLCSVRKSLPVLTDVAGSCCVKKKYVNLITSRHWNLQRSPLTHRFYIYLYTSMNTHAHTHDAFFHIGRFLLHASSADWVTNLGAADFPLMEIWAGFDPLPWSSLTHSKPRLHQHSPTQTHLGSAAWRSSINNENLRLSWLYRAVGGVTLSRFFVFLWYNECATWRPEQDSWHLEKVSSRSRQCQVKVKTIHDCFCLKKAQIKATCQPVMSQ